MENIEAFGDEIARRAPLLVTVQEEAVTAAKWVVDIMADNWAAGATEASTVQGWATFSKLMGEGVVPTLQAFIGAVGAHYDGLSAVTEGINRTEAANTAAAESVMPGGHRG